MDFLLRRLSRAGFRRGMAGEHWAWLALALAAFVLRRARRHDDDVVSLPIKQGERYIVSLSGPGGAAHGGGPAAVDGPGA